MRDSAFLLWLNFNLLLQNTAITVNYGGTIDALLKIVPLADDNVVEKVVLSLCPDK